MKLLLTSAGIANESIKQAFFELVGKKPEETTVAFIPTASNVEMGDKSWLIKDLMNLQKLGLKEILIADISAVSKDIWKPQLDSADVLFFEGGNTFHLMEWINASGLAELLPEYLKTKVYVGVSAGSMVTGPDLLLNVSQEFYYEDLDRTENMDGLNIVDFYVLPHFQSEDFDARTEKNVLDATKNISKKIYALDDNSAVVVTDGEVRVIFEGKFLEVN